MPQSIIGRFSTLLWFDRMRTEAAMATSGLFSTRHKRVRTPSLRSRLAIAILLALCLVWVSAISFGQANVGSIVGNVSDVSEAAISGADVTLLNPSTGERVVTQSHSSGEYVFNSVRPATYTISVEYKGFKTAVRANVVLRVAERISVDFSLEPGVVAQTIEVRAPSPVLQPETSSLGSVITEHAIVELPLNG